MVNDPLTSAVALARRSPYNSPVRGEPMAKPLMMRQDTMRPGSDGHDLIASAVRTLEAEAGGISALKAAIDNGLGRSFTAAIDLIRGVKRACDRHRHGQVGPCRPQGRGHARFDWHARLLRASERGKPWRPRHDHARRCDHGAVVVGRDRRAQGPHQLFAPVQDRPDRGHRLPGQCPGAGCRRRARAAAGARGPARTISHPPRRP